MFPHQFTRFLVRHLYKFCRSYLYPWCTAVAARYIICGTNHVIVKRTMNSSKVLSKGHRLLLIMTHHVNKLIFCLNVICRAHTNALGKNSYKTNTNRNVFDDLVPFRPQEGGAAAPRAWQTRVILFSESRRCTLKCIFIYCGD